ncbi:MAG TPA: cytochrome C biogenesis protein, partial [Candidatus Latescibacteria bacterium]|nr:cytochrome C biogenesis protein [Candidatus Latescibacterota bacterium]
MVDLGNFLIWLTLVTSTYALLASILAGKFGRLDLTLSAERAVYAVFGMMVIAFGLLEYMFLTDRFDLHYVATHSSRDLPFAYKFTA